MMVCKGNYHKINLCFLQLFSPFSSGKASISQGTLELLLREMKGEGFLPKSILPPPQVSGHFPFCSLTCLSFNKQLGAYWRLPGSQTVLFPRTGGSPHGQGQRDRWAPRHRAGPGTVAPSPGGALERSRGESPA